MAIQFNLLPWREERRSKITKRNQFSLIGALALGALLGLGYYGYEKVRLDDHEKALSLVKSKNSALQPKLKEKKRLDDLKVKLNNQIDAIEALQGDRASVTHMVEELSIANDQSLFLTAFNLRDGAVEIRGIAENDTQIADLMKELRSSEWYQEPRLIEIISNSDLGDEVKNFSITSQLLLPGTAKEKGEK